MFLVFNLQLVLVCCCSGIVGSFLVFNQCESSGFEGWLEEIGVGLQVLDNFVFYVVNLIVYNINLWLQVDLWICVEYCVLIVIISFGVVCEVVDVVYSYGGLVFYDVIICCYVEKVVEVGVDGLIVVVVGVGGYVGIWSFFVLVVEICQFFDKILLLVGCINYGYEIFVVQMFGVDLVYFGICFIVICESNVFDVYKQMILEVCVVDIVYILVVFGVLVSFMW